MPLVIKLNAIFVQTTELDPGKRIAFPSIVFLTYFIEGRGINSIFDALVFDGRDGSYPNAIASDVVSMTSLRDCERRVSASPLHARVAQSSVQALLIDDGSKVPDAELNVFTRQYISNTSLRAFEGVESSRFPV